MGTSEQIISQIEAHFGSLPPFFAVAKETSQVLELWQKTLSAYINNPLPALFKEKLFAYLSRYCSIPYSIVCHSCALLPLGMKPNQVLQLLRSPTPNKAQIKAQLKTLKSAITTSFPEANSELEQAIFSCCVYIFLNLKELDCCNQLHLTLGQSNYDHLMAFLSYVRTCHVWIENHPALAYQSDGLAKANLETLFTAEPDLIDFFQNYNQLVKQELQNQNVSDRQQIEPLQEDLLLQLTENIHQVFWINSPNQEKIIYVSPAYEEIWGRSREQLYQNPRSFLDSVYPEDRDRVIAAWPKQIQGKYEIEYRIIHPDSSIRWIRDRAFPILNQQREIERIVGIADDITERKQLQEEIKQSKQRLELALEAASMGTWDWNILTNKITRSDNLKTLFGKENTLDSTYQAFIQCVHPQDHELVNLAVKQAIEQGIEYDIEFRVILPNGAIRWVGSKGYVFRDSHGNPLRMTGVDMDITKRKQMEEQLRLLESVVVNANDAIVITEAEPIEPPGPRILYVNGAFTRMTGYTLEEVQGQSPRLLQGANSDRPTLDKIRTALKRWESICVELINYRQDGSEFWVEISIVPVGDEKGRCTHWVALQRDITERKQAQIEHQKLLAAEQAARTASEAANRTKDEFIAIVSHELRSPLNAVLGWARLLQTRNFAPAKVAYALEVIERNARLQTQLIEDLLDFSRTIRGKLHLNLSEVDLIPVIEAAIDVISSTAQSKNIQLNFTLDFQAAKVEKPPVPSVKNSIQNSKLPQPSLLVLGDPVRLQQIIWNLLSNAVKFTLEGGRVDICLEKIDNYAQIRVSDNGKGISPDFLPYVFERFRQANSTTNHSQGGLGLGLAIVQHLVELHNGTVHAASPGEGQGATFTVKLPLLEVETEHVTIQETQNSKLPQLSTLTLESIQVLVVDDEADTREFVTTVLEQYGARVTAVASADEALEAVERLQPNVVVSDIGMPGENGYSLIRKLRESEAERGKQIPAIALTAYVRTEDEAAAFAAGFQIHLQKPVDPIELAAVVANVANGN